MRVSIVTAPAWFDSFIRSGVTRGVLASYLNIGATIGTNLVAIPMYLHFLGREQYGFWLAVQGLVTYLGLLNLGVAQTTANRFGKEVARGDVAASTRAIATGLRSYSKIVAIALLLLPLILFVPAGSLFKGSEELRTLAPLVLLLSGVMFLVDLPLTIFSGCLRNGGAVATQQLIVTTQAVFRLVVSFVYLHLGGGLLGMVVVLGLVNLVSDGAAFLILRRRFGLGPVGWSQADPLVAKQIRKPSFYFFVLQICSAVVFSSAPIVIAAIRGTAEVVPYAVLQRLTMLASGIAATLAGSFAPLFLRAYTLEDHDQLRRSFGRAFQSCLVVGAVAVLALFFLGQPVITLWVGAENFAGSQVLAWLSLFLLVQTALLPLDALLVITSEHRGYALAACFEAVLSITLSIILVSRMGILGAAVALVVARCIGTVPALIFRGARVLSGLGEVLTTSAKLVGPPILISGLLAWLIPAAQPSVSSILVTLVAILGTFFLVLAVCLIMQERARLVWVSRPDDLEST